MTDRNFARQYDRCVSGRDMEISLRMRPYLPTLRRLAGDVMHATEFGFNQGLSAIALLAGLPEGGVLHSYDIRWHPVAEGLELQSWRESKRFVFHLRSSIEPSLSIEPTELLFIDSMHTANQLAGELNRHEHHVLRYLVLHDTEVHWVHGEDGQPGLRGPVEALMASGAWRLAHREGHGCGLMVFERVG
jgi:hypothetical protein